MEQIRRVGIDIDSTLADYMSVAVPLLQEHYGLEPKFDTTAYSIEEVFGLTKETRPPGMREHLYEGLHLFRQLPKLEEDNHQLTRALTYMRVKVYIVTARTWSPVIGDDTITWLKSNGYFFDDVFFTDHKSDLCKLMGIDVMVEDEAGQLLKLEREGIPAVVVDQPWNQSLEEVEGLRVRAHNWREVLNAIEEFLQ